MFPTRYFSPTINQIGITIALFSISAFFIGLVLAYGFRIADSAAWQRFKVPELLWLSTAMLVLSSASLETARYALRRALIIEYRRRLAVTLFLAVSFLVAQIASCVQLAAHGVAASGNPHGSAFYVFMGLHGAHLSGGMIWLAYLGYRSRTLAADAENTLRKHRIAAAPAAVYWHFMGILWVVLFIFLLRWTQTP